MKKQLRTLKGSRLGIDQWSKDNFPLPPVPKWVFGRHLRRRKPKYYPAPGIVVIGFDSGWYVWCYPSGRRVLSVLPF